MAQPFPVDNPFFRGYYAPLTMECDAPDLPVIGELPAELRGTLYRNGPNPQFAPRGRHHWFVGDGMLHAFTIADGRVAYRNRWVRTPKWELEHREGRSLQGELGNPQSSDPRLAELKSTVANTNVVWHGGRLLALEEQHAPFEVDPATLMPRGYHDFDSRLQGPMTAHPKIDPVNGEMVFFGYCAAGPLTPDIRLHVADREGRLRRSEHLVAPYTSMIHDFVVTQRHLIVPVFPLTGSMERAQSGRPPYAWEADKPTMIGILPRNGGPAELRWFEGEACYVFHPMNAFDTDDGLVVCDMMKYPHAPLFPDPDGRPVSPQSPAATLVRWTFDPRHPERGYREQTLCTQPGEFPRLDERHATRPYRHGYFATEVVTAASDGQAERGGLAHIDVQTGTLRRWQPDAGDFCGEPIFVERSADAPEGDGWLLSVVYRANENRSDLAVFDARAVDAGPIAVAQLSHRVPAGFHGNWRAA